MYFSISFYNPAVLYVIQLIDIYFSILFRPLNIEYTYSYAVGDDLKPLFLLSQPWRNRDLISILKQLSNSKIYNRFKDMPSALLKNLPKASPLTFPFKPFKQQLRHLESIAHLGITIVWFCTLSTLTETPYA